MDKMFKKLLMKTQAGTGGDSSGGGADDEEGPGGS